MKLYLERCAGLDVHKDTVVACARIQEDNSKEPSCEVRTFKTTTKGLLELSDWLSSKGVTHAAMESTGVYWKPIWHILEEGFELVLANAKSIKNVPGRKTDVNDATWIAELFAHGLIRASFVPPTATQELRDLTRTRKQLVREAAQHVQRIQKTLEDANIKVTGLITNIMGKSGRAMLSAIINGETDPEKLAGLAQGLLKKKQEELVEGLRGHVTSHHRFLLQHHMRTIEALEKEQDEFEARIGEYMRPFEQGARLLETIPGISKLTAEILAAEIGMDMNRFPTADDLVSWAGLSPGNNVSAGKHMSSKTRKTGRWLKPTLVQAAKAAARTKGSYLQARYKRIKARAGAQVATVAVANTMLRAAYHMLKDGTEYKDLGPDHLQRQNKEKIAKRLVRKLKELGVEVEVKEAA